jgi:hypothetical protein
MPVGNTLIVWAEFHHHPVVARRREPDNGQRLLELRF